MYRYAAAHAAIAMSLACSALLATPASAITTMHKWNGTQDIGSFGCPDTTTYGQVITVPASKSNATLHHFTFEVVNNAGGDHAGGALASMVVRGEVYAWGGSRPTGSALWESKPRTISYSDSTFHELTFDARALPLTPGAQYVLFASTAKDYAQCLNNYTLAWGSVSDSTYPNGTFVYQNNGGDSSQWESQDWTTTYGQDLAFRAGIKTNIK